MSLEVRDVLMLAISAAAAASACLYVPTTVRRLLTEHLHEHMGGDQLRVLKPAEEEERKGLAQIHDLLGGAA